jgi:hypothetical protein
LDPGAQAYAKSSLNSDLTRDGGTSARAFRPSTRQASTNDVTHNAVPPTMNVMTTMSQSGR